MNVPIGSVAEKVYILVTSVSSIFYLECWKDFHKFEENEIVTIRKCYNYTNIKWLSTNFGYATHLILEDTI